MKKVILDENVPVGLRHYLVDFEVVTVDYLGWNGVRNGALVQKIEGIFDVLVTGDKNLRYQQRVLSALEHNNCAILLTGNEKQIHIWSAYFGG